MPLLLTETDIVKALLQSDKDSDETLESLIGQNNANSSKRPLNLADPDLLQSYEDLTDYLCRDLKAILPKFDDALIPKEKPPERSSSQDIDRTDPMPFGGHSSRRESSRVNTVPFGKHEKIIKDNPSSPKELLQAKKSESESSSSQGAVSSHGIDRVDPVLLGERVVLRTGVRVPVEGLVELHKHFKDEERKANELVTTLIKIDGGSYHVTNDFSIPVKSAVQEMYKENLRTVMRSSGMFPPESNLIPVQQQVLQEFYEEHGLPNEAEKDLLMVALRVDRESIELWFKTKVYHLRAYLTLRNRLKLSCKPSDERRRMALMLTEEYGEKDFFHH